MKLKCSVFIILILYVYGNESVPYQIAANSGENSLANEYNVMHDFNFPDVTYPTSLLDTCQPFYFNSNSNGLDSIVGPFSSDVKSNYLSLLSHDNENKVKDEAVTTNSYDLKDDIVTYPLISGNAYKQKKSKENRLESIRKSLAKFLEDNEIDPELEDILSLLYSDEVNDSIELNSDNYLNHNISNEIEPKINFKDVDYSIEQIVLPPLIESMVDSITSEASVDEIDHISIENDEGDQVNTINSSINEYIDDLIIKNDSYENLHSTILADINITEPIDKDENDTHTNEIKEDSEPSDDDIYVQTENLDDEDQKKDIVQEDIEYNSNKTYVDEQLSKSDIIDSSNYINNHNTDDNITQPIDLDLNNKQNRDNCIHEDNNQLRELSDLGEIDNDAEVSNIDECTLIIPKEAVVFDVVSKDGNNLEKPLLDIVPSNIPVRLKINIEICKPDSMEKDDVTEGADVLETLNPNVDNIELQDLNNSIENIDENELVAQEQITVLDEINDSDFISALSILLLDSLNNKPIEILPSEAITAECDRPIVIPNVIDPIKCKDDDFVNINKAVHEEKPPTVPNFIYSHNNLNGQTNGYVSPSEVEFTNPSPIIDTFSPMINISPTKKANGVEITEIPRTVNFMKDSQEYKVGKRELLEGYPLIFYPYNNFPLGFLPKLV